MLHCEDDNDPLSILVREEEQARIEEEQDQIEEKQARERERIVKVLIPGDFPVYGLSEMARNIGGVGRSPQWLRYGLQHHRELKFVQRNPLRAMMSSLQNFGNKIIPLIATRVRQEQQDRGRARGKANKRCQMWHLSGPR